MEFFLSFAACFALPIVVVLVVLFAMWIIKANKQDATRYKQEKQEKLNALREKGITAPAIVISAQNGMVQGSRNNQRMLVTFEVEVQPEGRPSFQTTFKDFLHVGRMYTTWGARPEDVGVKIWVTYDPNDVSQIMFEYYDKDRKYHLGRPTFDQLENRNKVLRNTGEDATALILETEDLELTNVVERDYLNQTILRLKLEVAPRNGQPYQAEAQALFSNASLQKYSAGKKVNVKFNSQDRAQVVIMSSVSS